ncbi:ABC transporter permease [Streptomyces sp. DSM 41972]|uniref:ABC transporter permease n=1 Tax=Streptomyces althioticus subsp. attaecolombicae TaxID=3075534 RepID=A0ABU3I1E2_9ACTN|nr:ABC transporter permease [Streptomyces sp. DSM 41972]SCD31168.1 ABC-2 family transporter protein [Streptomyces sp. di50b]SCE29295.1 ABC-2 family transporter protein [Streptomyces sp. di188]
MRELLAAELDKARAGRVWPALIGAGLALAAITVLSLTSDAASGKDAASAATVTDNAVRYWMTMHLFSAIFGALFVTREYASGVIARSVLLSGGRGRLLTAKVVAALGAGLVFAGVAACFAVVAPWTVLPAYDLEPEWTAETWKVLAGVVTVTVLAAPWGVLVGCIARDRVGAVMFLLVTTMAVEPYLHDWLPGVGKYLLTVAMSSVYLDTGGDLLPVPAALAVIAAWLAAAWWTAHRLLGRRDVL